MLNSITWWKKTNVFINWRSAEQNIKEIFQYLGGKLNKKQYAKRTREQGNGTIRKEMC